ncbi:hypothetical protein E4U16_002219 [Claviceps sp. LM84 group G4]|nr:hypothetical protein E4U16_002219 [Claviceps sp. LM84 group G4]
MGRRRPRLADAIIDLQNLSDTPLEFNPNEVHDRIEAFMREENEKRNRIATSNRNTRRRDLRGVRNRTATSSTYTLLPEFDLSELHDRIEAFMREEKEKRNRTATSSTYTLLPDFDLSDLHDRIEAFMREEKEKRNRTATSNTYTPLSEFDLSEIHDRIEASMREEQEKRNRTATSRRNTRLRRLREENRRHIPTQEEL